MRPLCNAPAVNIPPYNMKYRNPTRREVTREFLLQVASILNLRLGFAVLPRVVESGFVIAEEG